jgi:acetyl esterase
LTVRRRRPLAALAGALALVAVASSTVGPAGAQAADVRNDVEYGTANGKRLLLDAYVPAGGEARRPAVVMIHGGGWRVGDKASWADEAQRFAGHGWVAFSINYRLDEPSVFPAEIDDAQAAVRWVRAHAEEYRVDPARIAALGESAGGHLTAMLATLGSGSLDDGARIRVGAAWSPPVDLRALAGSRGDGWAVPLLGCTLATCPDRLDQASPVTHVDRTDAPLYLANSTDELVPLSQAQAMAERLQASGVEHRLDVFPGTRHALDFRADAWAPTLAFLESHLAVGTGPRSSSGAPVVVPVAAAVAVMGAAGALVLRRRRRPAS